MREASEIRTVLVALDASPGSLAAAEAAAELAALYRAELVGLFVVDAELLRLASSPLAREIDLLTALPRPLDSYSVEAQLRIHARRAEHALGRMAVRSGLRWSFRVVRGAVASEIAAAAAGADLVSLGRVGWTLRRRRRRLGPIARALLAQTHVRTLVLDRPRPIGAPIVVLHDGSASAREGLELALGLAERTAGWIDVVVTGEGAEDRSTELARELSARGVRGRVECLACSREERLARALSRRGPGLLIVPVGVEALSEERLQRLLDEVACPLLAVRREGDTL